MSYVPNADLLGRPAEDLLQAVQAVVIFHEPARFRLLLQTSKPTGFSAAVPETGFTPEVDMLIGMSSIVMQSDPRRADSTSVDPSLYLEREDLAWQMRQPLLDNRFRSALAEKLGAALRDRAQLRPYLQSRLSASRAGRAQRVIDKELSDERKKVGDQRDVVRVRKLTALHQRMSFGDIRAASHANALDAAAAEMGWGLTEILQTSTWNTSKDALGVFEDRRRALGLSINSTFTRKVNADAQIRPLGASLVKGIGATRVLAELAALPEETVFDLAGEPKAAVLPELVASAKASWNTAQPAYAYDGTRWEFVENVKFDPAIVDAAIGDSPGRATTLE